MMMIIWANYNCKLIGKVRRKIGMGVVHKRVDGETSWQWDGVEVESYTSNKATKQVLVGLKDGATNFVIRYFTIPPRGFSSLDEHAHDHGVVVMNGHARVMLGEQFEEVGPGDVIYIPGWERHQFENLTDEPFTFLCVIPPKPIPAEKSTSPAENAAATV
jgi:quercetin dioxygenase-like cupin family protein